MAYKTLHKIRKEKITAEKPISVFERDQLTSANDQCHKSNTELYVNNSERSRGVPHPTPLLFLDQTEARRAKKKIWGGDHPPPHLKVWIHH